MTVDIGSSKVCAATWRTTTKYTFPTTNSNVDCIGSYSMSQRNS